MINESNNALTLSLGVYILGFVWGVAFLLCWITIRTKHNIGKIAILLAIIITLLVLTLPEIQIEFAASDLLFDKYFMIRCFTISVLLLSTILGLVIGFLFGRRCAEPIEIRKVRTFGS